MLKLRRVNGILSKLRHYVPRITLISVYYAIFFSHLNYCIKIWGQPVFGDVDRISKLQNHAIRVMSFADYGAPVDPLYRDLGLIKFNDLVHLKNSLFVHSIFQKTLPESLLKTFEIDASHAYPTRASKAGLLNSLANKTTYFGINSIKNQCILY